MQQIDALLLSDLRAFHAVTSCGVMSYSTRQQNRVEGKQEHSYGELG